MAFAPADSMFHTHEDNSLLSSFAPPHSHDVSTLLMRRSMSFSGVVDEVCVEDEMSDDGSQLGGKKRRLNLEQVKALEKSFELGNKLEPERKMQLARALGLQPRQIAIWFQNRRARWKTKQLERDYDVLKRQLEALKVDNETLKTRNKKLHRELLVLNSRESPATGPINLNKETDQGSWSNGSENSCDIKNIGTNTRPTSTNCLEFFHSRDEPLLNSSVEPATLTHLLQSTSKPGLKSHIFDQTNPDESLCNIFNGAIDDQPSFWPWSGQQHFQ